MLKKVVANIFYRIYIFKALVLLVKRLKNWVMMIWKNSVLQNLDNAECSPDAQIFIYYTLWSKHLPKIILNKIKAGRIFTEVYQECKFTQEDFLIGFAESIVRNLTPVLFLFFF